MSTFQQPIWNFEQEPYDEPVDETSYNLRAYFDRMSDAKLRSYRREWSDAEMVEWDGNFKSDGFLMLGCSERDVDADEYRRVLHQAIAYRDRVRDQIL